MKKAILLLIILVAFLLRLYRIDNPLADWHSWRQADTAAVSRNFVNRGFDLLRPRFDDLSNVASGLENPEGYRFVEFPVYNAAHAFVAKFLPFFTLEKWGRLLSVFFSLGSLIFLYLIAQRYLGEKVGLLTAFFFAVLPFSIYYSRVVLPEPMMLFASLGMVWFFGRWVEKNGEKEATGWLFLATLFAAVSWLIKPFTLVLLLPIACLGWQSWRLDWKKYLSLFFYVFLSLVPFLLWRRWMANFPEGIPYSAWLFNLSGIRLKGAWFYWLFAERVGKLILGYWGLILFGLGIIVKRDKKEGLFFLSWLAAIFVYFVIVAGGNVQHDYYQVLAIPIICVFLAKGSHFLLTTPKEYFSRLLSVLLFVACFLFLFAFSWYQVRDFFNVNNPVIVEAGEAVDLFLPKNAKVIAPYGGDTAFLYHTQRQGWPIGIQIEEMIEEGATHYVNVNFDEEVDWLSQTYCVLEKTEKYIIIDLQKKCQPDG